MRTIAVEGGHIERAASDALGIRRYWGVPYAGATGGPHRWRPPRSVEPWTGVRACDKPGWNCPQPRLIATIDPSDPGMSEDCLTLDIWTPTDAVDANLPVLVWIPGGAFLICSTRIPTYDGGRLAGRGLVVVAINYRVGVFGFLAHPQLTAESPDRASGNYGLLDQIRALRWIRENISQFGGDPGRVTIAGHSAGATSVNILMLSPLARGLFDGAFAAGGSAMTSTGFGDGSPTPLAFEEKKGAEFGDYAGATDLAALRSLPAQILLDKAGTDIGEWAWNACIDGHVLPKAPAALLGSGAGVPLLVGWAADEGAFMAQESFGDDDQPLQERLELLFPSDVAPISALYPSADRTQERASKAALAGDGFIGFPAWSWLQGHVAEDSAPAYAFHHRRAPTLTESWRATRRIFTGPGAFHGCEMPFFCDTLDQVGWRIDEVDRDVADTLADCLANFVRRGDPNGPAAPFWPPYDLRERRILWVGADGDVKAGEDPNLARFGQLAPILARAPGALRYRGLTARYRTTLEDV